MQQRPQKIPECQWICCCVPVSWTKIMRIARCWVIGNAKLVVGERRGETGAVHQALALGWRKLDLSSSDLVFEQFFCAISWETPSLEDFHCQLVVLIGSADPANAKLKQAPGPFQRDLPPFCKISASLRVTQLALIIRYSELITLSMPVKVSPRTPIPRDHL